MREINIGIIGLGTVGSGVLKILKEKEKKIREELGANVVIRAVCDRDESRKKVAILSGAKRFTTESGEIINDPAVDIVVELIGGLEPAFSFMKAALDNGKHVVTANKEVISQKGQELFELAAQESLDIFFEASVGGGIPIIKPLKEVLLGNDFSYVMGIVNGTTNYILTEMQENGVEFEVALKMAKEKGYAEPDPAVDIEGDDAASKIAILASLAFNTRVTKEQVYKEGISGVRQKDIEYAGELGYSIKLLACAKKKDGKIYAFVRPALLKKEHPLSAVRGVYNAIFVEGDACGQLMFYGEGAGSLAAGSSVVGDIVQVARNILSGSTGTIGCTCYLDLPVCLIDELEARHYILLKAQDKPGVLAKTAGCFAEANVSIASVIQKESSGELANIVFMTHKSPEKNLKAAIEMIRNLDVVDSVDSVFMVVDD